MWFAPHAPILHSKPGESATAPVDDVDSAQLLLRVMDWCEVQPDVEAWAARTWEQQRQGMQQAQAQQATQRTSQQGSQCAGPSPTASHLPMAPQRPPIRFMLAGHSRGAKIAVLAAAADRAGALSTAGSGPSAPSAAGTDPYAQTCRTGSCARTERVSSDGSSTVRGRVASLALLDPADASYDALESERFPSCLHALSELASAPVLAAAAPAAGDGAAAADGAAALADGAAALADGAAAMPAAAVQGRVHTAGGAGAHQGVGGEATGLLACRGVGTCGDVPAPLPVMIVGFGRNGDCIPRRGNYDAFFRAATDRRGRVTRGACAALVVLPQVRASCAREP